MSGGATAKRNGTPFRQALTLLEMIVALVLSMLLMAVVTQLTRRVLRVKTNVTRLADRNTAAEGLADQFERDLLGAQSISVWPNGLMLTGPIGFESTSGQFHGQDVTVVYRIVAVPGQDMSGGGRTATWLCRDQSSGRFQAPQREMLWPAAAALNVSTNELGALESVDAPEILFGEPVRSTEITSGVPSMVDIQVLAASGNVILQRRYHHHEE